MPNNSIQDVKPQFVKIGNTRAVFQTSTITYNQAVQYSSGTVQYGGSDNKQDSSPINTLVIDIKPNNQLIQNL
jgi:hypothetical protein